MFSHVDQSKKEHVSHVRGFMLEAASHCTSENKLKKMFNVKTNAFDFIKIKIKEQCSQEASNLF